MVELPVDIKLCLDFNQLSLKMQKRSFHVFLINKTRLNSVLIMLFFKPMSDNYFRTIGCHVQHLTKIISGPTLLIFLK